MSVATDDAAASLEPDPYGTNNYTYSEESDYFVEEYGLNSFDGGTTNSGIFNNPVGNGAGAGSKTPFLLTKRALFWGAVGVVTVASGTTLGILLTSSRDTSDSALDETGASTSDSDGDRDLPTFSCPSLDSTSTASFRLDDISGGPINLSKNWADSNVDNAICKLWLVGPATQRQEIAQATPMGDWGPVLDWLAGEIIFDCQDSSCTTTLPSITTDLYYELTSSVITLDDPSPNPTNTPTESNLPPLDPIVLECPTANAVPFQLPSNFSAGVRLILSPFDVGICSLWRVEAPQQRTPVARSYENNPWELYGNALADELHLDCTETECILELPSLGGDRDAYFEITAMEYTLDSPDAVKARFLEQATFGPRSTDIDAISSTGFEEWISDQISMDYFSHRAYYRRHLNARSTTSSTQGVATRPCQAGARYRKFAFSDNDRLAEVQIQTDPGTQRKLLLIDNELRTVLNVTALNAGRNNPIEDGTYEICRARGPRIGSSVPLRLANGRCQLLLTIDNDLIGNPRVYFDDENPPTNPWVELDGKAKVVQSAFFPELENSQEIELEVEIDDEVCSLAPLVTGWPSFDVAARFNGEWYLFDPRWVIYDNTVEKPSPDGGGAVQQAVQDANADGYAFMTQCGNVEMNFVNEGGCFLSEEPTVCSVIPEDEGDGSLVQARVQLTKQMFRQVYRKYSRVLYSVKQLRQDEGVPYFPPCSASTRSRWIAVNDKDCSIGTPGAITIDSFVTLLNEADTSNPEIRDVFTPAIGNLCNSEDLEKFDFQIFVEDQCWQNVHQDYLQVFDFTPWVGVHRGGSAAILQFVEDSTMELLFPGSHDMNRWHVDGKSYRENIGRFGDTVQLALPLTVVEALGAEVVVPARSSVGPSGIVCGSPNEVSNSPTLPGILQQGAFDSATPRKQTTTKAMLAAQKAQIWMEAILRAPDQLRQKVAWALAQLLVITPSAVEADFAGMSETFLAYNDIFVRHAFGNYRDILKEVTYSPLMGEMLSYLGSRSTAYVWQTERKLEYADENYAREVMQLFSIGLYKLRSDGTFERDAAGNKVYTYTNDEISEYARLYTGFKAVQSRGNIENSLPNLALNPIDPMAIAIAEHDSFPKLGLDGQYIGDGFPLCTDLPEKHFLKAGAKYRLLGRNPIPRQLTESPLWFLNPSIQRLKVEATMSLHEPLCNQAPGDKCEFIGLVELSEDLECNGMLCEIEAPRVLEVDDGVFYEYIRPACSRLAFYDDAAALKTASNRYYCEDKSQIEGSVVCCGDANSSPTDGTLFDGERVSFEKASIRCQDIGKNPCPSLSPNCSVDNSCDESVGLWTLANCDLKVKIDLEGRLAIVHAMGDGLGQEDIEMSVNEDTKSFFRVVWSPAIDNFLANYEATCAGLGCQRDSSDNLCLCTTFTNQTMAFETEPSREEVLSLKIGAHPGSLDGLTKKSLGQGLNMYTKDNEITRDTVFEVLDNKSVKYLRKNLRSEVIVGGLNSDLKFQNPVHMVNYISPELRDVGHEVDAALDHYIHHANTGPFLAKRLAKRFGNSNPSPRFVEAMSTAFQTGIYEAGSTTFGTGVYGDLMAMVACMLLDRESRSIVLDSEPTTGSVLEPFSRFIRLLRSMEYVGDPDRPLVDFLYDLQPRIGQMPYQMPSVFSFFLPEYQPGGPLNTAGLTCPECQQLTSPSTISLMNGLLSLIKYGLEAVNGGFAVGRSPGRESTKAVLGSDRWASGSLKFRPADPKDVDDVIQQLSTLLTAGRLADNKRALLAEVYSKSLEDSGEDEAFLNVLQLIATTPEFHTNTMSDNSGGPRAEPEGLQASEEPYKAVVFLMLDGGYDSFNLLVPHSCPANDLVDQYYEQRGKIGLTSEERTLLIDATDQPCEAFAIHPAFPMAKDMYDLGDLAFVANAGIITTTDINNKNYQKQVPFQLFAHNNMQHEAKALDGFDSLSGTGIMGRIASVLSDKGHNVNSIALDGPSLAVQSESSTTPDPIILSRFGAEKYSPRPETETLDIKQHTANLNGAVSNSSSMFGDLWSHTLLSAINQSESFRDQLDGAELGNHWPETESDLESGDTPTPIPVLVERLMTLSKLIQTKDQRGVDRDFFYVNYGGWDHHRQLKENQQVMFTSLNEAIEMFVIEMKDQGRFDDVTVVVTSDFGRTMTPNSGGGSDHAWGGNYFLFGGSVDGGKIHGSFPTDITPEGELNLGRGRLLPTTSWDCVWNAVSEWLGVSSDNDLDYIMPNRRDSSGTEDSSSVFTPLLKAEDLFETDLAIRKN